MTHLNHSMRVKENIALIFMEEDSTDIPPQLQEHLISNDIISFNSIKSPGNQKKVFMEWVQICLEQSN